MVYVYHTALSAYYPYRHVAFNSCYIFDYQRPKGGLTVYIFLVGMSKLFYTSISFQFARIQILSLVRKNERIS